jgi:hypothetical protein
MRLSHWTIVKFSEKIRIFYFEENDELGDETT